MKTNLDKFYKNDENLEKNGVWFDIADDVGFLIKPFRASNPQVKASLAKYHKPYARQIEAGTLDAEKALDINIRLFVNSCLVDWRGVEIDGVITKYSHEIAMPFFKSLPDLFFTLWEHAQDFKNYREELGNS